MIIVVETQAGVPTSRLEAPDDFARFDVRIVGVDEEDARRTLQHVAVLETNHALVEPTGLFSLPGARPEEEQWIKQFEGMVEYARSKGWVDGTGRIQAHVVWG